MSTTQTDIASSVQSTDAPVVADRSRGPDVNSPETDQIGPLSPEHIRQLVQARIHGKKVRRAVAVATFNGWGTAVFAGLTGVFGIFNLPVFLLGAGMGVIAYIEFKGAAQMRRFDDAAPRRLGFNQIGFAALLSAYAMWQIVATLTGPSPFAEYHAAAPEVANVLGPYEELMKLIMLAVYMGLIVFAAAIQGGTALYYFTRSRHIRAYVEDTPQWIVQLQRSGFSVA